MIKKKIKLYYKGLVHIFFNYLYGKILLPKKNHKLFKKEKIVHPYLESPNNKKYHLYKILDGRIFTDNNENVAIIKNNFVLPLVSFQQINGKLEHIKKNFVISEGTPSFVKKINGKVFNLCQGDSGNNYFHFIFDILPKIYLLNFLIDLKKIDYFYVSEPKKWQVKIFNAIGINERKLINSKKYKHIHATEIYAVDHPWYNKGYIQHNVKKIPKWIIFLNRKKFLNKSYTNFKKKIFLDRSESKYNHCQIKDTNEIKKLINAKKFEVIKPELLSFKKQINLFKNSNIIIGAHGAAFSNIIFCKPGTKIIEIIPSDHPNKKCERISKVLKFRYFRITTKPDNSDKNYPFRINIDQKNLRLIEKIINL
tara:strand:- start:305 stop:1402 length:1098 start_codon:yes stop_codon:yes gene_type:complete